NRQVYDKKTLDFFKDFSLSKMLELIKKDLKLLRVTFDIFFSEKELYKNKHIEKILAKLNKYIFNQDDAIWLKTTLFGDDKDRVLVKKDSSFTYFLPDIAYHEIKLTRNKNITKIFNIWGADHKSYVDRMTIAIECLGIPKEKIHVIIMQMVSLTKDGKEFKMSKRTGNSLTLRDLIEAIGVDSSRWALVSQTADTQIEIDINKFKLKTHDNNLYYVLYAYARINQLFKKINFNINQVKNFNLDLLVLNKEKELINYLVSYPSLIETIAKTYEVNKITNFLFQVSQLFHSYYNEIKIKDETDMELKKSRCILLSAIMFLIHSGLNLLDIEPKEKI
ncbi:MAG: arginine--tRNA ligase, partial [Malacoplasma sp.]|nr:arginine--tRNA ligase [Malacoplasma sp.]